MAQPGQPGRPGQPGQPLQSGQSLPPVPIPIQYINYGPHHKPLPCAANSLCYRNAQDLKIEQMESRINQEKDARRIVEQIAQGNYIAYSREKVQSERVSERLDQLVELLRPVLEERGRERIQMDYAAVFVQRDALERKAKKFEGECERLEGECERLEGEYEQLAQENAKLKQVLSQGGNEGGISAESTKRKRT